MKIAAPVLAPVLPLVRALRKEIPSLAKTNNVESLHRARVSARRLHNYLWLCKKALPGRRRKSWDKELRRFLKVLGPARDLDVQIRCFQSRRMAQRIGTEYLDYLRQQRREMQPALRRACGRLKSRRILTQIAEDFPADMGFGGVDLAKRISLLLAAVSRLGKFAACPRRVKKLHALRITLKHLRYALEALAPERGKEADYFIQKILRLHNLLGDLHDLHVWVGQMKKFAAARDSEKALAPAVAELSALYMKTYERFLRAWRACGRDRFWNKLRQLDFAAAAENKVAVVADIHANLPAFQAVFADIRSRGIKTIWNLGDMIGYAPFPEKTVRLLRRQGVISVVGNYDQKVLAFSGNKNRWQASKSAPKYFSFCWTAKNISAATRQYLRRLPAEMKIKFAGKNFLLVHGSPQSNEEALSSDTSAVRLRRLAAGCRADVILCGHSHRYFSRKIKGVWFANPGSVGRPFDRDPRASYMIVTVNAHGPDFQNQRVAYPVKQTVSRMRKLKFPLALIESIAFAESLDDRVGKKG